MIYSLKKLPNVVEDRFTIIDQDGIMHESPEMWLWIRLMKACGCGSAEELANKAYEVLLVLGTPHEERVGSIYDDNAKEVITHWITSLDIAEHGCGIGGSWLTEKGRNILDAIKKVKEEL